MRRLGKGSVVVVVLVVVVTVVFVVESFSGPFYFGTTETDFGHFVFGTSSDRALVFDLKTFRCFGLKIRFGFLGSNPGEIGKKILIFFSSQLKTLVQIKNVGRFTILRVILAQGPC